VAAVATIYREMNSLRWTVFSVVWQLLVAYVAAFLIYSAGMLLGLGNKQGANGENIRGRRRSWRI
jgi:hypothetical protein